MGNSGYAAKWKIMMKTKDDIRRDIAALVKEYYKVAFGNFASFTPGKDVVHYAGRVFDESELLNLVDSSLDFWLTSGRFNEEFETELAGFLDLDSAITVNSGSSANLIALSTLTSSKLKDRRLKPGDEVITAAAGFPTTVNPIIQNKAIPVFIDVETGTYVPSLNTIENAITEKTKAVMIAHTMGVPYEVSELKELCRERNLWLIEDNCDALGSRYDGKYTGTFGDLATMSFYPAHHITMGEGGAVVTNDDLLAKIARSFRDWGRDCYCNGGENNTCGKRFSQQFGTLPIGYDHKYVYSHIGYNLKITDMQAAVGAAQIKKLPDFISARKENHSILTNAFAKFQEKLILHTAPMKADPSWFGYVLTLKPESKMERADVVRKLEDRKIETRNLFCGNILRHPAYENIECRISGSLKNSDLITTNSFFIGVYPGLKREMLNYIIEVFNEIFG